MERKEHAWESLVIADEPERIISAGCPECGLEFKGPEAEVEAKMHEHAGCFPCYPPSPKTADELERLRAENTRLRGELQALREDVAKYAAGFEARVSLLLATLMTDEEENE